MIAVGPYADDGDGHSDVALDEGDVVAEGLRQGIVGGDTAEVGLPAGELLIGGFAVGEVVRNIGKAPLLSPLGGKI